MAGRQPDPRLHDALGIAPIRPLLAYIDAMKGPDDVQKVIGRLHAMQVFVPFGLASNPDNHDPTRVVANIFADGLGLPDRDHCFKTEARFQEARDTYRDHVARMFRLAGSEEAAATAAATSMFDFERRLAESSLDNVALRDPLATDHTTRFADLPKLAPHFDWDRYFTKGGLSKGDLNVREPKFVQEVDRQLAAASLGRSCTPPRRRCRRRSWTRTTRSTGNT